MKTVKKLPFWAVIALTTASLGTASSSAEATAPVPYYKPCAAIQAELTAKVIRLKNLAREREAQGDSHGARRLRNNANIITAHIGNLPCVNRPICPM
jgi:hypothetical protein